MARSLKIDDALQRRIESLAAQRERSADGIMLEAISEYLDREEARASFRQEALESWAAFQTTGRHITGEELRDWLESWGGKDERPVPECHD